MNLTKIIRIVSLTVFLVCTAAIIVYLISSAKEKQTNEDVRDLKNNGTKVAEVLDEYAGVYAENQDTIGWLKIDGTAIDYVVMYAPDEIEKYLRTDFYGNHATGGCLFVDEYCDIDTSDNLIIYGHNMHNGTMFADLLKYESEDFGLEHRTIHFDTIYEKHDYELVAAIYTDLDGDEETGFRYYEYVGANDEESFEKYCDFIEKNRLYDTGVTLRPGDRILTLSTCSYHSDDGRFILVARRLD